MIMFSTLCEGHTYILYVDNETVIEVYYSSGGNTHKVTWFPAYDPPTHIQVIGEFLFF